MQSLTQRCGVKYHAFGVSQDKIGWRRFMEGMISRDLCDTKEDQYMASRGRLSWKNWKQTLVKKLLEVMHGQWLYRNVHVHDSISGKHALERKEKLRHALLDQLDLGDEELDKQVKYLLETNLGDLDTSTGDDQEY